MIDLDKIDTLEQLKEVAAIHDISGKAYKKLYKQYYNKKYPEKNTAYVRRKYLERKGKKFTRRSDFMRWFLSYTLKDEVTGCWNWQKNHGNGRYYMIYYEKKLWFVHRLSYFLHYEVHPDKLLVCHKCDNPRCINPEHLFLGTQQDNINDKVSKKRHYIKLNDDSVKDIKFDLSGLSKKEYAAKYSIDLSIVYDILRGEIHKSITAPTKGITVTAEAQASDII